MLAHGSRLPLALTVTAAAAGGATLLLRPRAGPIRPAAANAGDYFTHQQLERAREWAAPQRLIGLGRMAAEGALVARLAARPPRVLERLGRRPVAGAAAAGAVYSAGSTLALLPLSALSERRSRRFGLSTQSWAPWTADVAKATALGALESAGGAALFVALARRYPSGWWVPAAGAVAGVSAFFVFIAPVVIDPLFNDFTPLPDGPLRSDVVELARRAGVRVKQVYRVDASRRTTATNAYVYGLGATKRVVLYDTLIDSFPGDQVRSVIAHELSHVVHRDVQRGLAWLALVALPATLLVKELGEAVNRGRPLTTPEDLPALALAAGVVAAALGWTGNALSRRLEARADAFALDLTRDPDAFIGLTRSLALTNLADPSTPRVYQWLFASHPPVLERIGAALQWASAHSSTAGNGP